MIKSLASCIFLIFAVLWGCTAPRETEVVLQKTTATGTGDDQVLDYEMIRLDDDYFEISLYLRNDDKYSARQDVAGTQSIEDDREVFLVLVDPASEPDGDGRLDPVIFETPTDFLNFMSDRGYEMIEENRKQSSTEYTFKKK